MGSELEVQLQKATRRQLLTLIRELATRYPHLYDEISSLLPSPATQDTLTSTLQPSHDVDTIGIIVAEKSSEEYNEPGDTDEQGELEEEWDFNSDELLTLHPQTHSTLHNIDYEAYRRRLSDYSQRLQKGEPLQSLQEDLNTFLEEAEQCAEQHDYRSAIHLYALVLDERLDETQASLTRLLDKAIDDIMPILETLLSEVSSNIIFDSSSLAPQMSTETRQQWLERLFALWLQRLDAHYLDESIPEMMLNIAWSEDVPLLRHMVQKELQHIPASEHSNIVDFSRQYRTRTLERFLRELPHG